MSENPDPLTCAFHPKRETNLRCNRCNKPICVQCAHQTPIGYRCPECIRNHKKKFITARWYDYITSVLVSFVIAFLASFITSILGFYSLLLAVVAGFLIARAVRMVINNRRSPTIHWLTVIGTILGSLYRVMVYLAAFLVTLQSGDAANPIGLVLQVLFTILAASAAYYQLRS